MKNKKIIFDIIKILIGLIFISPLFMAVIASFMPKAEILTVPLKLSLKNATLENYIYSLKYMNLLGYFKNTFVMLLICLPCQLFTSLLAAYAFSYFEFPLKNVLFTILTMIMMIPGEVVIMTHYKMIMNWGMIDSYAGLTITSLTNVGAMFMFRQAMRGLPRALWEAAILDGCGKMQYFFTILVPLCRTVIVTFAMNSFIAIYNNYMWPMLVTTRDSMRTIQTGVVELTRSSHSGIVMAAAFVVSIIPVIVYLCGMDMIVEGITAGAVKD